MPYENPKKQEKYAQHIVAGRKTAGVATSIIGGRFLSILLSGISFIIVARILGPSTYGIFTIAIAYATFFTAFGDFGVGTTFSKLAGQHIAKNNKKAIGKVLSNGYALILITSLAFTVIALLLSGTLAHYILGNNSDLYVVQIASLIIVLSVIFSASYYAIVGLGNGLYIALTIIVQSVLQSIISIILVLLKFGALGPILGTIIGYAIGAAFALFLIVSKQKIRFYKPSLTEVKDLLKFSAPISAYTGLRAVINNLSPIILGLLATTVIVGNFGVAVKTANLFLLVTDSITFALLPMFASTLSIDGLGKNINKLYNYSIYLTFVVMVPAMLYVALLAKQFSFTAFSANYVLTPMYLPIIAIGILLWAVATYTTMLLIGRNMVHDVFKYSVVLAAIEFVLMFVLIHYFKGFGLIVLLYLISPTLLSAFSIMFASKRLAIKLDTLKLMKVVTAGIISALFLIPITYLPINYIAVLAFGAMEQLILYPPILAIVGGADKKDLKSIKDVSQKLPLINTAFKYLTIYSSYFAR